jgi:quercetin dioxygenase-like cupin family protein
MLLPRHASNAPRSIFLEHFLFAAFFLVATVQTVSAQIPTAATPVGSSVFLWDSLMVKQTGVGLLRPVVDAPTPTFDRFELHITTLNPGRISHPPHHHPQEEIILIKEGTVESSINGHTERLGAGSLLFFASHDVHNLTNVGTEPATYYVINFYTPATAAVRDQPAAEWAPPGMLRSSAIDWDKLEAKSTANDTRRYLVNSPTLTFTNLEIHATTVQPGRPATPAHRHPWIQLIVMKEGIMQATINGVPKSAGPGSIIFIASNDLQSMKNVGSVPATYHVIAVSSAATPKAI